MRNSAIILILSGLSLLGFSWPLEPYANQKAYEPAYYALEGEHKSQQFHELRALYLTKKHTLENYGLTLIILGVFSLLLFFKGWNNFKIPKNKLSIAIIGISAVIVTAFGYVAELFLESSRGTFPHWADSIGIPLASVPIMVVLLCAWFALNLMGLLKPFKTGGLVKCLKMNNINYWFLFILSITVLLTLILIFRGYFWMVTAGILWSYYYLCLLVGRRDGITEKELQCPSKIINLQQYY